MVDLVKEISSLEKKQKPARRPTWVEVLGEEKTEALHAAIINWANKEGVATVFSTRKDFYEYLMGVHSDYPRDRFFDVESYPDYRRFSEYMNEYPRRVAKSIAEKSGAFGARKGSTTK